jgi:hypothetical protein
VGEGIDACGCRFNRDLIRLAWQDPDSDNHVAVEALLPRDDWPGNFAVVERDRLRIRPLPNQDGENSKFSIPNS